jgi:hypothetical protein
MNLSINRWLSALVGLSLLITVAFVPGQARGDDETFSGQATVINATVLGNNTKLADTGPLPSSGGALEASLITAHVDGISVEVLHAATVGQENASRAEAVRTSKRGWFGLRPPERLCGFKGGRARSCFIRVSCCSM